MNVQWQRILPVAAMLGCVQLASEFDRVASRDAASDRTVPEDQRMEPHDVGALLDSTRSDDVTVIELDRHVGTDSQTTDDVGATKIDAGSTGPLRLREHGFTTGGVIATGGSSVRLLEWGFELGQTTCSGTLCVTGGLTP